MKCKENWFQQQPLFHLLRYLMWGAVKLYGCHHLKCSCELIIWIGEGESNQWLVLETHFGEKQLCLLTSVGVVYSQPFCKIDKKLKLTHIDHWMLLNIIAVAIASNATKIQMKHITIKWQSKVAFGSGQKVE